MSTDIVPQPGDPASSMPAQANFDAADPGTGKMPPGKPMPAPVRYLLGAYVIGMFAAIFYLLVKLWPLDTSRASEIANFFWGEKQIPAEIRLMLIAALAGALGAYVHLATSFADYAGNESLTTNWGWWYLVRPFIGMSLAEVVYLSLRGGLLNAGGNTGAVSVYGISAVAALTGLFSKQATDKLQEVFETLFRTEQKVERKDTLRRVPTPSPAPGGGTSTETAAKTAAASAGPQS